MNFPTTRISFLHIFSHEYSHYLGTVRLLLGGWGVQKGEVYQNLTPPQKKHYLHMKIVPPRPPTLLEQASSPPPPLDIDFLSYKKPAVGSIGESGDMLPQKNFKFGISEPGNVDLL